MSGVPVDGIFEKKERRKRLLDLIKKTYPDKKGAFLLCAAFERDREQFYQESSFEYFIGIQEPAAMVYETLDGEGTFYVPRYAVERSVWLPQTYDEEFLGALGITSFELLGQKVSGYSTGPFYTQEALENVCKRLATLCQSGGTLFVPLVDSSVDVRLVVKQLFEYVPKLKEHTVDISNLIAQLRREKSQEELEHLYHAVEITAMAQQAAAGVIKKGNNECDVQAAVEYVFTESKATRAFASVIGSGKNSTILHYVDNKDDLKSGSLVVVDIGASFNHYCADVTRTYPVSGTFSERQKKVYEDVLEAQRVVAEMAKPGMYLKNTNEPEKSLYHVARKVLSERGYNVEKDFPHGIGHYVGLDVHDVGDYTMPLAPGDIITIEPGIYLSDEELGIRIEDMYWIVKDGAICLSEEIPKKIADVERFMRESRFSDDSASFESSSSSPVEH